MKRKNLYTLFGLLVALIVGFLIGISVDFPKVKSDDIAGTIGKVSNYRNVTVSDEDIQLRSDLATDPATAEAYANFYSFHYTAAIELTVTLESTIKAASNLPDFMGANKAVMDALSLYQKHIGQARGEILLALNALRNIDKLQPSNIGLLLNNANLAISQMSYNDDAVIRFIDQASVYLEGKSGMWVQQLRKSYNHLAMLQATKAVVSNDKPKMKYLDGKELFAETEKLNWWSQENLNAFFSTDQGQLKANFPNIEQLGIIKDMEALGLFSNESLLALKDRLGLFATGMENLGFMSNENLGIILNAESLGIYLNVEKLGQLIESNENLASFRPNVEQLGLIIP